MGWAWIVPIVAVSFVFSYFAMKRSRALRQPLMEAMASELGGRITKGTLFAEPKIHLRGDPEILISMMPVSERGGGFTYAWISRPPEARSGARQSGGAATETILTVARRQVSIQDWVDSKFSAETSVGDRDFERDFIIRTKRPEIAWQLLTWDVKRDLASYERLATLVVRLSRDRCWVTTSGMADSEREIRRLAKTGELLRERFVEMLGAL